MRALAHALRPPIQSRHAVLRGVPSCSLACHSSIHSCSPHKQQPVRRRWHQRRQRTSRCATCRRHGTWWRRQQTGPTYLTKRVGPRVAGAARTGCRPGAAACPAAPGTCLPRRAARLRLLHRWPGRGARLIRGRVCHGVESTCPFLSKTHAHTPTPPACQPTASAWCWTGSRQLLGARRPTSCSCPARPAQCGRVRPLPGRPRPCPCTALCRTPRRVPHLRCTPPLPPPPADMSNVEREKVMSFKRKGEEVLRNSGLG